MNDSDIDKINFIKVNLQIDNLVAVVKLIERAELVRAIEMVPHDQRGTYNHNLLINALQFIDVIDQEILNSLSNGQPNG